MNRSPSRPGALSRRRFLAATSAALLPMPALAQAQYAGDVDVAIVGGGAAGIAAARKIAEAGRNYVLLEAGSALGGRARTVSAFGQDIDLGASGFARTDSTLAAAAQAMGSEITPLPSGRRLFLDGREAHESAYDAFSVALGKARRDMLAVADTNKDPAAATVIGPVDGWAATSAQLIGPLSAGRALASLSTLDLVQREAPPDDATSVKGIGALIETLGSRLNVQTGAAVSVITNAGRFHTLTLRGQRAPIRARAIIVAVPAPVIAAGALRFNPVLPPRLAAAFRGVPAGFLEQVVFRLPRNPLGLQPNETVLARAGTAPPALLRGRINGGDVHVLTFGDAQAREIAEKGEAAALNLVRTYLATAFELDADAVSEVVCSRWGADPLFRGALVAASPGQGAQRRLFADTVQNRIFLAGDYVPTRGWGTLAAAWSSGEAAAARALRLVGDGPA
ncbi:amine oxidase [Ancylobacter novellus DSM 506]|uniref:Tryptophan 2-monooxygenase n=1 Tax=Ancylobacter novellus (strain ATCC 8093 / DSM 506 / JCM 20403 / CCM 1077 / IAM 12100 / NBRC 12443 / NCIMB 10456) TaxID=639283 RepID=D7A234_ANCN5|nr:FAD-dependent oxidoreductase [Ancylobacter novellus]ADH87650.1 amine oxidase [Ancylobacter novellus DSM 506]